MSFTLEKLLEALLDRRETGGASDVEVWDSLDPPLRRRLKRCMTLERELSALALAVRGHAETAGPWELLRPVGRSRSGPVYLAEHSSNRRRAAVRLLHDPRPRFSQVELEFCHPASAVVIEATEDWIATEWTGGIALSRVLETWRQDAAWDPEEISMPVLRALAPVAEALRSAHDAGFCHLGLSPRKLDLCEGGSIVIRDFAHDPCRGGMPPTADRPPLGSPLCLSPEQVGAPGRIGPATDIFSFAVIVRTIAAGYPPRNSRSLQELLRMLREEDVGPTRIHAPWLPEDLASLLDAALERRPEDRRAGLDEIADLLREL